VNQSQFPKKWRHSFVNTYTATVGELEDLSAACQAATFGRGSEDVLDETYRKAGKLDSEDFSTKIHYEVTKMLASSLSVLYDGDDLEEMLSRVIPELYKLNLYGTLRAEISHWVDGLTQFIQVRGRSSSHTRIRPEEQICLAR
jgi:hypothetical protein